MRSTGDLMATYYEKLKDPRWQKRRFEVMNRAQFACQICHADNKTLNVHHHAYRRGFNPWDYADSEMSCLCRDCHEMVTRIGDSFSEALAQLNFRQQIWADECLRRLLRNADFVAAAEDVTRSPDLPTFSVSILDTIQQVEWESDYRLEKTWPLESHQ